MPYFRRKNGSLPANTGRLASQNLLLNNQQYDDYLTCLLNNLALTVNIQNLT